MSNNNASIGMVIINFTLPYFLEFTLLSYFSQIQKPVLFFVKKTVVMLLNATTLFINIFNFIFQLKIRQKVKKKEKRHQKPIH